MRGTITLHQDWEETSEGWEGSGWYDHKTGEDVVLPETWLTVTDTDKHGHPTRAKVDYVK